MLGNYYVLDTNLITQNNINLLDIFWNMAKNTFFELILLIIIITIILLLNLLVVYSVLQCTESTNSKKTLRVEDVA